MAFRRADLDSSALQRLKSRGEPLYQRIFSLLRSKIYSGAYRDGGYLPSEHELAAAFKVSRITAKKALNELAATGLVVRERGRGTWVRIASVGTIARGPSNAKDAAALVRGGPHAVVGHVERRSVLDLRAVPAPADVAKSLGIAADQVVHRSVRLLTFEEKPYAHMTVHLRPGLGALWTKSDLEEMTLAKLLELSGVNISRAEEEVSATTARAAPAKQLVVPDGTPLLKIVRTSFDADDRPIEHLVALHPPARYRYIVASGKDALPRK